MQDAMVVYQSEPTYVETSLIRRPYLNFSYGHFSLGFHSSVDKLQAYASELNFQELFLRNYSAAELQKWNSTKETILPPIDDRLWLTLALLQNVNDAETDLVTYATTNGGRGTALECQIKTP